MVRKIQFYTFLISFCLFFTTKAFAATINEVLRTNTQFNSAVVGISVKDTNSGNVLYQMNSQTLLHPASTLKLITSSAAYDYLGGDYQFKTAIYKNGKTVYFKVGADPLFSYDDMFNLVSQYRTKYADVIKNFIIDDRIIDKEPYGIGWQWDDNTNVHFTQMSPYIINHNLFTIKVNMDSRHNISIEHLPEYKEPVINRLKYAEKDDLNITRNLFRADSPVVLAGNISKAQYISIPAKYPQQLYNNMILIAFLNNNIPINVNFKYEKVPLFSSQEAVITHSINDVLKKINQFSDNLAAEILLKHAAGVKNDTTGTTESGLNLVREYYENKGLSCSNIQIVDASGASMNDYITADFMTSALRVIAKSNNFNIIKNSMTDFNNGTFKGRLPELNGKLKVKTGTNANTSAVVGYLTTKNSRNVSVAILIDNLPKDVNAKEFENKLLKAIYDEF